MILRFLLTLFLLLPASIHAEIIFFDDFNQEPHNRLNVTDLTNWDVISGSLDVVGYNNLCTPSHGSCLDMDGTNIPAGPLTLESKQTFDLSGELEFFFDISGSQRDMPQLDPGFNSLRVTIAGVSQDYTLSTFDPWRTEVIRFTGAPSTIRFDALDQSDFIGVLVDNVGIREVTPVPEPSSLSLIVVSGLLAWVVRKRIP